MGMFNLGMRIGFSVTDAIRGTANFNRALGLTEQKMKQVRDVAKKHEFTINQTLEAMRVTNAPAPWQRNVRTANASIRSFTSLIKEGRAVWKMFTGETKKGVRVGGVRKASRELRDLKVATVQVKDSFGTMIHHMLYGLNSLSWAGPNGIMGGMGNFVQGSLKLATSAENARVTFDAMLGSADKSKDLLERIGEYAAKTAFTESDVIEGSKRLLSITEDNVDENERLYKIAGKVAALRPGSKIDEVSRGMVSATMGEFEIMKGTFGIMLNADMFRNQTGSEDYKKEVIAEIERQISAKVTPGVDLVEELGKTLTGKISTLQDNFERVGKVAGKAFLDGFGLKEAIDYISPQISNLAKAMKYVLLEEVAPNLDEVDVFSWRVADFVKTLMDGLKEVRVFLSSNITPIFKEIGSWGREAHMLLIKMGFGGVAAMGGMSALAGAAGFLITVVGSLIAIATPFMSVSGAIAGLASAAGTAALMFGGLLALAAPLSLAFLTLSLYAERGSDWSETWGETARRLGNYIMSWVVLGFQTLWTVLVPLYRVAMPYLDNAIRAIKDSFDTIRKPIQEFFSHFTGRKVVTMEDMARLGMKLGWVLGQAINLGAIVAAGALRVMGKALEWLKPTFKPMASDIMAVAEAFFSLTTNAGDFGTKFRQNISKGLRGLADVITYPFRVGLLALMDLFDSLIDDISAKISPISSRIGGAIQSMKFDQSSRNTVIEGFLGTQNRAIEPPNLELNLNMKVDTRMDGKKVGDALAVADMRGRNSRDPVTPDEMGFALEGGNRIRVVGYNEVAGKA